MGCLAVQTLLPAPTGGRATGGGQILPTAICVDRVAGAHIFGDYFRGGYSTRHFCELSIFKNSFGISEKGTLKRFFGSV
jgi:hypothetical protein